MTSTTSEPTRITELLRAWQAGDRGAEGEVLRRTYSTLRRLASRRMREERAGGTLQPTALVHEAYLRLASQRKVPCENREQFVALTSRMMGRVLLDRARSRRRLKHGGDLARVPLAEDQAVIARPEPDSGIVDAVRRLAAVDPIKAAVVELRCCSGLTLEEVAAALGCSRATVARHWRLASAWLRQELVSRGHGS